MTSTPIHPFAAAMGKLADDVRERAEVDRARWSVSGTNVLRGRVIYATLTAKPDGRIEVRTTKGRRVGYVTSNAEAMLMCDRDHGFFSPVYPANPGLNRWRWRLGH